MVLMSLNRTEALGSSGSHEKQGEFHGLMQMSKVYQCGTISETQDSVFKPGFYRLHLFTYLVLWRGVVGGAAAG